MFVLSRTKKFKTHQCNSSGCDGGSGTNQIVFATLLLFFGSVSISFSIVTKTTQLVRSLHILCLCVSFLVLLFISEVTVVAWHIHILNGDTTHSHFLKMAMPRERAKEKVLEPHIHTPHSQGNKANIPWDKDMVNSVGFPGFRWKYYQKANVTEHKSEWARGARVRKGKDQASNANCICKDATQKAKVENPK